MTEATWDQRQADVALAQASAVTAREVFAQHLPFVWRTLRCQNVAPRDVEDVAQEVFVVIFKSSLTTRSAARFARGSAAFAFARLRPTAAARAYGARSWCTKSPSRRRFASRGRRRALSRFGTTHDTHRNARRRQTRRLRSPRDRAAPDRRGRRNRRLPTRDRLLAPRCREEAARRELAKHSEDGHEGTDARPRDAPRNARSSEPRDADRGAGRAPRAEARPVARPETGIPLRPLYAATAVLAVLGLGLVVQPYAESAGTLAKRDASASMHRSARDVRSHEAPTAPEKARVETPPSPLVVATKAPVARPVDELPARSSTPRRQRRPSDVRWPSCPRAPRTPRMPRASRAPNSLRLRRKPCLRRSRRGVSRRSTSSVARRRRSRRLLPRH